jgi:hypothetical protein
MPAAGYAAGFTVSILNQTIEMQFLHCYYRAVGFLKSCWRSSSKSHNDCAVPEVKRVPVLALGTARLFEGGNT